MGEKSLKAPTFTTCNNVKQNVRVTRSDPISSTYQTSHSINNSKSHHHPSGHNCHITSYSNYCFSKEQHRNQWICERMFANNQNPHDKNSKNCYFFDNYSNQNSNLTQEPNSSGGGINWISENDSETNSFRRPHSLREQRSCTLADNPRYLEDDRQHCFPIQCTGRIEKGNFEDFFERRDERDLESGGVRIRKSSRIEAGVTQDFGGDEEEDNEEEADEESGEEGEEDEEGGGDKHCYLSRQTKLPYPYCLKGGDPGKRRSSEGTLGIGGGGEGDTEGISIHSGSPYSITSESTESLGDCENTLDLPHINLPNGQVWDASGGSSVSVSHGVAGSGRKFSLLFSSSDAWSEESIIQSFRDLDPVANSVFEAAWTGNRSKLEEILIKDEGNLRRLRDLESKGFYRDGDGRTPLHLASAWGHVEVVKLLLEKGAPVNAVGTGENETTTTPLSCAASCGSVAVVKVLLEGGANVNAGYGQDGKTALHWAVQCGSWEVAKVLLEKGAKQNPPKVYSETPLHVAASQGDEECLKQLLDYGADVNLCRGSNRSTALHFSSEEGSAGCVRLLLKKGANHQAKDIRGHTALHVAATCDADCVIALLKAGADPNAVDANGRTPLHCAVAKGSRAAECVRLLVESGADIDAQDNYGYTPLHLSAVNESSQCASILLHHGSDVTLKTNAGTNALSLLVRRIPDVMRYLVDRLDSAVTIHDHDPGDPDCEVRLDFRAIVPNCEKKCATGSNGKFNVNGRGTGQNGGLKGGTARQKTDHVTEPQKETEFLTCLLATGNKRLLMHPLSEAFLCLKWRRVRKFFWASLLFHKALVFLFTIYVVGMYLITCPYRGEVSNMSIDEQGENAKSIDFPTPTKFLPISPPQQSVGRLPRNLFRKSAKSMCDPKGDPLAKAVCHWFGLLPQKNATQPKVPEAPAVKIVEESGGGQNENSVADENSNDCELSPFLNVVWYLLMVFTSLMAIKEVFQLIQSPLSYLVSSENWGQWLFISSVTVAAWTTPESQLEYWQYLAAACGIFLAWGLMFLQVGRFPAFGLYVQMLCKVAANFGSFILAYACLLIAFALAFCVLIPEHPSYPAIVMSFFKVFTMMAGEIDYKEWFYDNARSHNNDDKSISLMAHLLYVAFVVIVTMVLMNFLVGLAVNDIQGLEKGAKLNRLCRQTVLISSLESFIFSKKLQSILPLKLGSILKKSALLVPSSYNWSFYFRPNDPRDKRLPKEVKLKSFRLAFSRHSSAKSNSSYQPLGTTTTHDHHHFSRNPHRNINMACTTPYLLARPVSSVSQHLRHYSTTPVSPGPGSGPFMDTNNVTNLLFAIQFHSEFALKRTEQRLDSLQNQLEKALLSK